MNKFFLHFLDYFFLIFHTLFTLFNMFGWLWKKTRKIHLATMLLTLASWFILGIWYGWGFCFCTDWHWQVRDALQNPIESDSYVHFLILEISGVDMDPSFVDNTVFIVTALCFILSCVINFLDYYRGRVDLKKRHSSI